MLNSELSAHLQDHLLSCYFAAFSNKLTNSVRVFALQGHWRLQRQPLIARMHLAKSFAVLAEALIHFSIAANLYCGRPLCFAPLKFINMVHFVQHVAARRERTRNIEKVDSPTKRCRRSFIIFIHFAKISEKTASEAYTNFAVCLELWEAKSVFSGPRRN